MKDLSLYSSLAEIQFVLEHEVKQIINSRKINDMSIEELKSIINIYSEVNKVLKDRLEVKYMELDRKLKKNSYGY